MMLLAVVRPNIGDIIAYIALSLTEQRSLVSPFISEVNQ
jgi:hypothetical protein